MFRYTLKKTSTQETKAIKEIQNDILNPWSDEFEKNPNFCGLENDFEIEKLNIVSELEQIELKKQKILDAKTALSNVKSILADAKALSASPEKQVLVKLSRAVLQLSKVLYLADANDSES